MNTINRYPRQIFTNIIFLESILSQYFNKSLETSLKMKIFGHKQTHNFELFKSDLARQTLEGLCKETLLDTRQLILKVVFHSPLQTGTLNFSNFLGEWTLLPNFMASMKVSLFVAQNALKALLNCILSSEIIRGSEIIFKKFLWFEK